MKKHLSTIALAVAVSSFSLTACAKTVIVKKPGPDVAIHKKGGPDVVVVKKGPHAGKKFCHYHPARHKHHCHRH